MVFIKKIKRNTYEKNYIYFIDVFIHIIDDIV